MTVEALAEELDIPVRIVRELLDILRQSGFVVETAGEDPSFQPSRDIEQILIIDVLRTLKNFGGIYKLTKMSKSEKVASDVLDKSRCQLRGRDCRHDTERYDQAFRARLRIPRPVASRSAGNSRKCKVAAGGKWEACREPALAGPALTKTVL